MMYVSQLPILVVIVPLFAAFLSAFVGLYRPNYCFWIALVSLTGLVLLAASLLTQVLFEGTIEYALGGWKAPIGIVFVVDRLNALVLMVIAIVSFISAVHSAPIVKQDFRENLSSFYSLYLLLVTGLAGMTITGDAFNLYIMVEIVALSNYALIAAIRGRASMASFNYLMVGTVGAGFYLLGIGYLYIKTGTLNMADIRATLPPLYESKAVLVAFGMMVTGLFMKMALFPFHGWLPNAYTYAPNPVSCLIAPLTTKVSMYVLIRILFWIFSPAFVLQVIDWNLLVVALATGSIMAGGLLALAQTDLKRMLTYIVVTEVGYVVGGIWLVNRDGFIGAVFHIVNDALVTLCVFMVAASIAYKLGGTVIINFRGLFKKMPLSMTALVIGALTLIGVPPTSGFFSKWYLISGAIAAEQWHFVFALIFASVVNVILFFRVFEAAHFGSFFTNTNSTNMEIAVSIDEAPPVMLISMLTVACGLLALGLMSQTVIRTMILPVMPF